MDKIVIFATCHGNVIERLLSLSSNCREKYILISLLNFSSPGVPSDPFRHYNSICESELFLYQENKLLNKVFINEIRKYTNAIKIPYVTSSIYWPSMVNPAKGGRLLINEKFPYGIIPFRCKVLDDLISKKNIENEIVQEYCSLNLAKTINLDIHYHNQIEYLKNLDADNQFIKISDFIDKHICSNQLFYLFNHPSLAVFRYIIDQLFDMLGVENDLPEKIPDNFYYHQQPIHPSVVKHYGLDFVNEGTVWPVGPHKVFFEDYVRLYIRACHDNVKRNKFKASKGLKFKQYFSLK